MRATTVADRIRQVLEARGLSARELASRAGLSHSAVGWLLRNPEASVREATLRGLARAAEVRVEWLLTGEGEAVAPAAGVTPALRLEYVERYPSRREAAGALAGLVRQDAIDAVLRWHLHNEEDPGVAWWAERIKELARQADLRDKSPAAVEQDKQRGLADTERVRAQLGARRHAPASAGAGDKKPAEAARPSDAVAEGADKRPDGAAAAPAAKERPASRPPAKARAKAPASASAKKKPARREGKAAAGEARREEKASARPEAKATAKKRSGAKAQAEPSPADDDKSARRALPAGDKSKRRAKA